MAGRRDIAAGGTLCAAGVVIAVVASGFPMIGGMAYGPGLFPKIVAVGLVASGAGIVAEGVAATDDRTARSESGRLAPMLGLLAVIVFFALALDPAGFHVTAAISLFAAVLIFGGGPLAAIALALAGTVVTHYVFYSVLRVPLPWGLLEPVAW